MNIALKKMKFEQNSKDWNLCTFYKIYMENDVKMIKIIGITDRESRGKNYLSWICTFCEEDCKITLEQLLLWDVYYQLDLLMSRCNNNIDVEVEPYECYEQANKWLIGDGSGSYFKKLIDLTENTPCDYYYGY